MPETDLISIIIPVYNVQEYLPKCISSVINQTYKNLEIIIVDDGSTDDSLKIINEYAQRDSRIVICHQENKGLSAARNTGMRMVQGDYVGFVDSDDYIEPDMYESLYRALKQSGSQIAQARYYRNDSQKTKDKYIEHMTRDDAIRLYKMGEYRTSVCNKLYSRNTIKNLQFVEGMNMEDNLFTLQTIYNSDSIAGSEKYLYHYIIRSGSITAKLSKKKSLDHIKAKELCDGFFKDNRLDKDGYYILWKVDLYFIYTRCIEELRAIGEDFSEIVKKRRIIRKEVLDNLSLIPDGMDDFGKKTNLKVKLVRFLPWLITLRARVNIRTRKYW